MSGIVVPGTAGVAAATNGVVVPVAAATRRCSSDLAMQRGQASVELVAMLPVAVAVMLAALQLLAAGATRELAGHAAGAGAVALLQRANAREAARDAVPGWSRARMAITVRGPAVTVRMRPPTLLPGLAALLESTVHADAGKGA